MSPRGLGGRRVAGLALLPILALALAGCTGGSPAGTVGGPCTYTPVSGFSDLHGLAVNPERPEELYAATHFGLFRAVNDTGWARVGSVQDDLMGFSVHPTNGSILWSSGHPRTGGNMGVRLSRDGGCTWQTIMAKEWDFHAMAVSPANPDHLWGFFRGELQRSTDGGHNWQVAGRPPPIGSLAPDPRNTELLYAAAGQRGLLKSMDGGSSWEPFRSKAAAVVAVDPTNPSVLYAGGQGYADKSTDGGKTWAALDTGMPPDAAVGYIAVNPTQPNVVYAATYQTGIYKSTDGGATWTVVKPPGR